MTQEAKQYQKNLEDFSQVLANAYVSEIIYDIDSNPTFDLQQVPFKFIYCNAVTLKTNKGNFIISTSMSSEGIDGLWTFPSEKINGSKNLVPLESDIEKFVLKNGIANLPFKMSLYFREKILIFYSGEIYDSVNEKLQYKINDEMILVFDDEDEALIFESLTKYS